MGIAEYRTQRGATRYLNELSLKWPAQRFVIVHHPIAFGWTTALAERKGSGARTYVAKRPANFGKHS
jgi:hypothetical protein